MKIIRNFPHYEIHLHSPITNKIEIVKFDVELRSLVLAHEWKITKSGYVQAKPTKPGFQYMHDFILPIVKGKHRDHENRDKLDNRSSNLRYVTPRQNIINSARCDGKPASEFLKFMNSVIKGEQNERNS
jgi:hypothetical protein